MAIYTSKFTQQEIDDGIDNANSALQPTDLDNYYDKDTTDDFFDKKVDKVSGKGLSTNDYTTDEKNKLAGIAKGAEVNVQSDWNATSGDAFIKNKPTIPDSFQWFGTSSTAADTVQKVVSIPSITSLKTGQIIIVQPTVTSTVANSTLKLNSFDAYPMRYNNAAITTSTDSVVWSANFPSLFVFDGSYWVFLGHGYDVTYSAMSVAEGTAGTATSSRLMRADYLKQIIQELAPQSDWNATSGNAVILNKPTIPTVNNGKFSIKGAGTEVASTTANASSASSVDIVAGSNVTVTPDATNRKITIAAKDTTYSVVSTSANGLAPKVTDTSKFLKGDGTWATPTDTNNRRSFYGTCDTDAATAAKAVTISDTAGWELKAGTIVGIKFTNTNSASNVTLNVNGSGAKSIWYNNAAYTGNSNSICGYAGRVTYYMYDGTYWVWLNMGSLDGNTDKKVTQTVTTTSADYEVLFSNTADNTTRTEGARKNSNLKFNPSTGNLQATQLNGVTIGSSPKFTDTTYSVMGGSGASHASGLVPDPGATAGTTKYLREDGTWQEVYTREEIDQKLAFRYDPATKGMVFPTDTSIVEYDATTKGMIFH